MRDSALHEYERKWPATVSRWRKMIGSFSINIRSYRTDDSDSSNGSYRYSYSEKVTY
jgi:hypothetical protein